MNEAVTPAACANCGEPFASPPPAFCPACGQESRVRAPTLGEFVQQFGGAYFSTEGALEKLRRLLGAMIHTPIEMNIVKWRR